MSYSRFSCDNWKSDVYVYGGEYGYVIHVAANRYIGDIPKITADIDNFVLYEKQHRKQMQFLQSAKQETIGLKYDGEDFIETTIEGTVKVLQELEQTGYHIPVHIIPSLIDDPIDYELKPMKEK